MILFFSLLLAGTASIIFGFLGSATFNWITNPPEIKDISSSTSFWISIASLASISIGLIETVRVSPLQGFFRGLLAGSLLAILTTLVTSKVSSAHFNSILTVIILVNLFSGLTTIIALSLTSFNMIIASTIESKAKKYHFLYLLFTMLCTVLIHRSFGSAISGVIFIAVSLCITQRAKQHHLGFQGLQNLAIQIACWQSVSFHDLDLSGINFSGAIFENCDFRAKRLYRTSLRGLKGLDASRVDDRYLDLSKLKVQQLLTQGSCQDKDFSRVNLQGAYLQEANLQNMRLHETNLNGADLKSANLQGAQLIRTIATGVDFKGANLTGACIQDWSINRQTESDGAICEYIYRGNQHDEPGERYPSDRNFELGEFAALIRQLSSTVELVFDNEPDSHALSLAFEKFQLEDNGLGLELAGIEPQGDHWIVKVIHDEGVSKKAVTQEVINKYELIRSTLEQQLEEKRNEVSWLRGLVDRQTGTIHNYSRQPLGNHFYIFGSTITNLAGSGSIQYEAVAQPIRQSITQVQSSTSYVEGLRSLLEELQQKKLANTPELQIDFLQQVLLREAEQDQSFRALLLQQSNVLQNLQPGVMTTAMQQAIAQLI